MYTAKNQSAIDAVTSHDKSILDVGCGTGINAQEIKRQFPTVKIVGINFSQDELDFARKYLDGAIEVDLNHPEQITLNDKFDLIICSHIVEHLIDPKTLLSTLEASLEDNGRIVVIVPNFGIWKSRLKILFGRFAYEDHGLYDRTHLRFFTYYTFAEEIVPDELRVVGHFENGHFPLPIIRSLLPTWLIGWVDQFMLRLLPNLFSAEIGLVLQRRQTKAKE